MNKVYRIRQGVSPYGGRLIQVSPDHEYADHVLGMVSTSRLRAAPGLRRYDRSEIAEIGARP